MTWLLSFASWGKSTIAKDGDTAWGGCAAFSVNPADLTPGCSISRECIRHALTRAWVRLITVNLIGLDKVE